MPPRPYEVELTRTAVRELSRLQPKVRDQIGRTIRRMQERYSAGERPQDIRAIEGEAGSYGIDSGEYRILYQVTEKQVTQTDGSTETVPLLLVWRIGHRRDVYRNL